MKDLVKGFDNLPWILKLILALPVIDGIAYGIYRIAKGIDQNNMAILIAGIVWILIGWFPLFWLIDFITVLFKGKVTVFA